MPGGGALFALFRQPETGMPRAERAGRALFPQIAQKEETRRRLCAQDGQIGDQVLTRR